MNLEEFNRVEILLIDKKSGSVSKIEHESANIVISGNFMILSIKDVERFSITSEIYELSLIKAYKRYNNNN